MKKNKNSQTKEKNFIGEKNKEYKPRVVSIPKTNESFDGRNKDFKPTKKPTKKVDHMTDEPVVIKAKKTINKVEKVVEKTKKQSTPKIHNAEFRTKGDIVDAIIRKIDEIDKLIVSVNELKFMVRKFKYFRDMNKIGKEKDLNVR